MGFLCRLVTLPRSYHPAPNLGLLASAQDRLRRHISAGDTLRARYPDHAQLSSLKERTQPAFRLHKATQTGVSVLETHTHSLAIMALSLPMTKLGQAEAPILLAT